MPKGLRACALALIAASPSPTAQERAPTLSDAAVVDALPAYTRLLEDLNGLGPLRFEPSSLTLRDGRARLGTTVVRADGGGGTLRLDHDALVRRAPDAGSTTIVTRPDLESLPEGGRETLRELFGESEPIRLESHYPARAVGGRRSSHALTLAPMGRDVDDRVWSFDGAELDLSLSEPPPDDPTAGGGALAAFASVGALRYVGERGVTARVDPSAWVLDLDASRGAGQLARFELSVPGEVNGSLPVDGLTMPIGLGGLTVKAGLDRDAEALRMSMAAGTAELDVPMVPLDSLELDVQVFGLPGAWADGAAAEALALALDGGDPEALGAALIETLLPALYASMLENGLGAWLSLRLSNGGGDIALDVRAELVGGTGIRPVAQWTTVRDLVRAVRASVSFDADAAALRRLPVHELLDDPRVAMVVARKGMRYTGRLELGDRVIRINGMPLGLELLFAERLDAPLQLPGRP